MFAVESIQRRHGRRSPFKLLESMPSEDPKKKTPPDSLFLASQVSSRMTGGVIGVTGGKLPL